VRFNLAALAWRDIQSRRARSWLTVLGVLIGVTAIVALISIGAGVENAVLKQYRDIGYDVVLLIPQVGSAPSIAVKNVATPEAAEEPTKEPGIESSIDNASTSEVEGGRASLVPGGGFDPDALRRRVPAIVDIGQIGTRMLRVDSADVVGYARVSAPSQGLIRGFSALLGGYEVAQGRDPDPAANDEVVLGALSPTDWRVGVGQSITIGGTPFTVVGVLAPSKGSRGAAAISGDAGQALDAAQAEAVASSVGGTGAESIKSFMNTDHALFVPYEQTQGMWTNRSVSTVVVVRIRQGVSVVDTVAQINAVLNEQGVLMTPISTQTIADQVQRTLGMVKTVLASIAAIALVVGAVGMMNTMYTSVLERTRAIGILKSIGAKDRQVLGLFLIDSGLMGLIGGILGLGVGAGLSFVGTSLLAQLMGVTSFSPVFTPGLFLGVVGFSLLLGCLAGAWPAWHAARLDPVEALAAE
jgi:putative ABC transport system permease protein